MRTLWCVTWVLITILTYNLSFSFIFHCLALKNRDSFDHRIERCINRAHYKITRIESKPNELQIECVATMHKWCHRPYTSYANNSGSMYFIMAIFSANIKGAYIHLLKIKSMLKRNASYFLRNTQCNTGSQPDRRNAVTVLL